MPLACWVNECAVSASIQVADFECVSQLENVHADSSAPLRARRRSLLVSPGRRSLQMISAHLRKFARCGGASVHVAVSLRDADQIE